MIALGRLGWPLRRIEQATGVRRETAGDYLRQSGITIRAPGNWGERSLAKAATLVTTDPPVSKPAIEVTSDSSTTQENPDSKAATLVTTDFSLVVEVSAPARKGSTSACTPYREMIALELSRGCNAMGIWQDLVDRHGFRWKYGNAFSKSPIAKISKQRLPA